MAGTSPAMTHVEAFSFTEVAPYGFWPISKLAISSSALTMPE
jgi:hypothetical protein